MAGADTGTRFAGLLPQIRHPREAATREMKDRALPEHHNGARQEDADARKSYYRRLFRKFILVTLVCSLLPLLGVGWLINLHYTRFSKARMMDSFHTQVEQHRRTIELYLRKLGSKLYLASHTVSREYLTYGSNLAKIFDTINHPAGSITDLGVIDQDGRHLAYVGPYDLMDKNYSDAFWFKEVMKHGLFISDMFLGFRKVPHFIIAVTREEAGQKWILRATVDTEAFRSLLENVRIGKTGEVYLVNTQGIFQSSPRVSGKIMEKSPLPLEAYHAGIRIQDLKPRADSRFPRQIVAQAWLEHPRWLLVVKQDYAEAFEAVNHANRSSLIFLHLSALSILIVSVLTARYLIGVIKKRDAESDRLNTQLLQTGKLASIGELSAGVAHEINNPLSIILTERQILLDLAGQTPALDKEFEEQLKDSLSQVAVQVQRCKRITQNLLKFSRRTKSVLETDRPERFPEGAHRTRGSGGQNQRHQPSGPNCRTTCPGCFRIPRSCSRCF